MIAQAAGGSLSITGEMGGRPLKAGLTVGDTGAGIHCAMGILAALYQRQMTGHGQRIEVAMQEAITNFARMSYARQLMANEPCPRTGNQSILGATSPSEAYPCKGGGENDYCYVYTSRAGNVHWHRLLKAIGREDLIESKDFDSPEKRWVRKDEVDAMISEWTLQRDKHEVMKFLGEAGVPAGAVLSTEELMNDAHLRERGVFSTFAHPVRGDVTVPGWPVHMSHSRVTVESPPLLGQHNNDIYCRLLNLKPHELEELKRKKSI
jgi:formyl-CoA transferase